MLSPALQTSLPIPISPTITTRPTRPSPLARVLATSSPLPSSTSDDEADAVLESPLHESPSTTIFPFRMDSLPRRQSSKDDHPTAAPSTFWAASASLLARLNHIRTHHHHHHHHPPSRTDSSASTLVGQQDTSDDTLSTLTTTSLPDSFPPSHFADPDPFDDDTPSTTTEKHHAWAAWAAWASDHHHHHHHHHVTPAPSRSPTPPPTAAMTCDGLTARDFARIVNLRLWLRPLRPQQQQPATTPAAPTTTGHPDDADTEACTCGAGRAAEALKVGSWCAGCGGRVDEDDDADAIVDDVDAPVAPPPKRKTAGILDPAFFQPPTPTTAPPALPTIQISHPSPVPAGSPTSPHAYPQPPPSPSPSETRGRFVVSEVTLPFGEEDAHPAAAPAPVPPPSPAPSAVSVASSVDSGGERRGRFLLSTTTTTTTPAAPALLSAPASTTPPKPSRFVVEVVTAAGAPAGSRRDSDVSEAGSEATVVGGGGVVGLGVVAGEPKMGALAPLRMERKVGRFTVVEHA
ncbi:hypothetical protein HDU96_000971 [Phlyctochytrium bullatum]|nr:hypothetical protein HDU96_000971 [Phlyctochytrium bullatum]